MSTWAAILLASAGCYALKLAGLLIPERVLEHPVVARVSGLLPVALLAALAGVQTFATGTELVLDDARVVGVGVAVVALLLRAPFIVVVGAAAAAAALTRALT